MLLLQAEELERQGIACQATSQFVFYNKIFTKGESFSKNARQTAIKSCNQYLKADIICLIVESQGQFTLWSENLDLNQPMQEIAVRYADASKYQNTYKASEAEPKSERHHQTNATNQADCYRGVTCKQPVKNEKPLVSQRKEV